MIALYPLRLLITCQRLSNSVYKDFTPYTGITWTVGVLSQILDTKLSK